MQKSDRIYHGCFTRNQDGTKRLIKKKTEDAYALQTNLIGNKRKKYPQDIPSGVENRSQEKNKKLVKKKGYNRYFRQVNWDNIRRWLEANKSEVRYLKESDKFYVVQ